MAKTLAKAFTTVLAEALVKALAKALVSHVDFFGWGERGGLGQSHFKVLQKTLERPWKGFCKGLSLQGRLTKVLDHMQGQSVLAALDMEVQARFLSATGDCIGAIYRAATKQWALHVDDFEFQVCAALRLGHPIPAQAHCNNRSASGNVCGAEYDMCHPLS